MKNIKIIVVVLVTTCAILASYTIYNKLYAKVNYGAFKIDATIYEDADLGISNVIEVELTKVYYKNNLMLEECKTDAQTTNYSLLSNKKYSGYFNSLDSLTFASKLPIEDKKNGLVYFADSLPNYKEKIVMNDTILDEVKFKRFAINTDAEYSVFYVAKKINLPYSFNEIVERDYEGTILRIDSYNRVNDRFTTLKLVPSDTIPKKFYNKLNSF